MRRQVVYLMSAPAHLPYLIVSLRSLREHWHGEVVVYAWSESIELVKRICEDANLCVSCVEWEPEHRKRNAQFECKQLVMQSLDCDVGLYLDADTMINGPIDLVFEAAEEFGFAATQFNDWTTKGRKVSRRIRNLLDYPEIQRSYVEEALEKEWPSVNGGVFASQPSSPVLPLWHKWTKVARPIFISDETVLHVMMPVFTPVGKLAVATGGKYNRSPKFPMKNLPDDEVSIWHFHGDCNTRQAKSPKGVSMWWPAYQSCIRDNVGGIAEWDKDILHNRHLNQLKRELASQGECW